MLIIAMGGDALIVSVVKSLVQSPRPLNGLIVASGFSYPSGHTAGSLVFYGSIAFVAWQYWKTKRAHALMGTGLAAAVCIVGFSRVYLGVHWFSDVFGAAVLGVCWLSFVVLVFKLLRDAGKFDTERFRAVSLPLFLIGIAVGVFVILRSLIG